MQEPRTYPSGPLDRPRDLVDQLGTFWRRAYANQSELDASMDAVASAWRQADADLRELAEALAFRTIPLLHVDEWRPVSLRSSVRGDVNLTGLRFGDGASFGDAGDFGEPRPTESFPVPLGGAVDAAMLCDSPIRPAVCEFRDVDYAIDRGHGVLWLHYDPFADPRWTPTPIYDDRGVEVDRELTVWLWRAASDERLLYRRLGYALGLRLPSTENARKLGNLLVDAIAQGTSELTLRRFFSALFDFPICESDGEVVEAVFRDGRGLVVATDRSVYRFTRDAAPAVSAGQALREGDALTTGLRFDVLNDGRPPEGLAGLVVGPGLLEPGIDGELIFVNADVPVRVAVPPRTP